MDTQNTSDPVLWLSLAKKHFKPKTIEVMVATTPPLMQDRKLPSSTYRYVHVRMLAKRHVLNTLETLELDFRHFRRKTANKMQDIYTNYTFLSLIFLFCLLGYKVITVLIPINVFQIYVYSMYCLFHTQTLLYFENNCSALYYFAHIGEGPVPTVLVIYCRNHPYATLSFINNTF